MDVHRDGMISYELFRQWCIKVCILIKRKRTSSNPFHLSSASRATGCCNSSSTLSFYTFSSSWWFLSWIEFSMALLNFQEWKNHLFIYFYLPLFPLLYSKITSTTGWISGSSIILSCLWNVLRIVTWSSLGKRRRELKIPSDTVSSGFVTITWISRMLHVLFVSVFHKN